MGLSGGGTTTQTKTVDPAASAAAGTLTGAYNQQAPKIQGYADNIGSLIPHLTQSFQQGNPAVNAQQDYITGQLGHGPGENPHLQSIIDRTNQDVTNSTNAGLGTRGLTGGSVHNDILSRNLASTDSNLRYQDYNNQQQLQAGAAGMAPGNAAASYLGISPLLAATDTAAGLPLNAATQYATGVGGIFGNAGTQKTTTPGAGLGGIFGSLLGAFAPQIGKIKF